MTGPDLAVGRTYLNGAPERTSLEYGRSTDQAEGTSDPPAGTPPLLFLATPRSR